MFSMERFLRIETPLRMYGKHYTDKNEVKTEDVDTAELR